MSRLGASMSHVAQLRLSQSLNMTYLSCKKQNCSAISTFLNTLKMHNAHQVIQAIVARKHVILLIANTHSLIKSIVKTPALIKSKAKPLKLQILKICQPSRNQRS